MQTNSYETGVKFWDEVVGMKVQYMEIIQSGQFIRFNRKIYSLIMQQLNKDVWADADGNVI